MNPDISTNEVTPPTEETEAEKVVSETESKDDDGKATEEEDASLPFNKHPRWQEMQTKMGELGSTNTQLMATVEDLKTMVERLSKSPSSETADEIMAELEKMDENRPASYKDMFSKFRELSKKADAKEQEQTARETTAQNQATIEELQSQLVELVDLNELEQAEITEFANWCAEKLNTGAPKSIYSNFHAALPKYRAMQAETAKTKTDEETKKSRSGVGASGASNSELIKIASKDLKELSFEETMRRSAASKK